MRRQIVSTLFPTPGHAERAREELIDAGYGRDDISLVPAGTAPENDPYVRVHGGTDGRRLERGEVSAKRGALLGSLAGAVAGAALGVVVALLPFSYALLTTVGWGLVLGALAGLASGMIMNANLTRVQHANYPRPETAGHTVLRVAADDDRVDEVRELLERHDPLGFDAYAEDHHARQRVAEATGEEPRGVSPR